MAKYVFTVLVPPFQSMCTCVCATARLTCFHERESDGVSGCVIMSATALRIVENFRRQIFEKDF